MNNQSKNLFVEKYNWIKSFLNTESQDRTYDDLIDMRNVLESFSFFIQFTNTKSSEFIEMCRYFKMETYSDPSLLFSQGATADKFYMILKGQAFIYIKIPGVDEEKQVGTLGIGNAFGELALLFDSNRNATIKVDADSELIVLHKKDFKKYMKFQSSEHANQAFELVNSMDEFKSQDFPNRVRLASKMQFQYFPSNHAIITQGQPVNNFYIVLSGLIKIFREVDFTITDYGKIGFSTTQAAKGQPSRTLKIEIDEIGPGRFFGDYELVSYKPSQQKKKKQQEISLDTLHSHTCHFDFNIMSQIQLQSVCQNAKPYPKDEEIRGVFLNGVQWRVFRKKLVEHLSSKKELQKIRDPSTVQHQKFNKEVRMFDINQLSFAQLKQNYLNDNQFSGNQSNNIRNIKDMQIEEGQVMFGTEIKTQSKQSTQNFFNNVDVAIKRMKQDVETLRKKKLGSQEHRRQRTGPTTSKVLLPKINPKIGSNIYNLLIQK